MGVGDYAILLLTFLSLHFTTLKLSHSDAVGIDQAGEICLLL